MHGRAESSPLRKYLPSLYQRQPTGSQAACESAYRDVVKLVNALAIVEVPAGFDYTAVIDLLNAEIDHYKDILARKGKKSGSGGNGGGTDDQGGGGDDDNPEDIGD